MDTHYPLQYHSLASDSQAHQINASVVHDPSWHHHIHLRDSSSPDAPQSAQMYDQVTDHVEYPPSPPPAGSYIHQHQQESYHPLQHSSHVHSDLSNDAVASSYTQVPSSIGPDRVLTRRQRAALEHGLLGRRTPSSPEVLLRASPDSHPRRHSAYLFPTAGARHDTPDSPPSESTVIQYQNPRGDRLSLNISSIMPMQLQSPRYSSTPASASSQYSPFDFNHHSRSNSASTDPRSVSPAVSVASAITSVSSSTSAPNCPTFPTYPFPASPIVPQRTKNRKQRLFNVDRKDICIFAQENPNARQEDIANRYGVERSTISKILKQKQKWLNVPAHEEMRIAKHRPSKFPEIEEELVKWLVECQKGKKTLTDALIRSKAKETARMLYITEERFKASSGWIENFKHRHGIRAGVWEGNGKNTRSARALGAGGPHNSLSPTNPVFGGSSASTSFQDEMDMEGESEGSSDPNTIHHHHHLSSSEEVEESMSLQPAWPEALPPSLMAQPNASPPLDIHNSMSFSQQQDDTLHQHVEHMSLPAAPSHMQDNSPYNAGVTLAAYEPPALPSLADAEEAMNKLLLYLDSTGQHLILPEERQTLHSVKCALFQAANGASYNRQ